ncbi:uncharacterized protein [Paramormyrops kingsleyae]|uniref:uncharacterized protein isoform X3 n=1 Tax=Paramormyrops kingsleyae TaxID=1676925 RepID=UPI000CD603C1|nr:spermatogenesis- and oogenesis-specific basic helix-loop-helix-containing protein 1 isoform X3 [Paramormyrops kingsleyae]
MDHFATSSQNELILLPPQLSRSVRLDSSESDEEKNLNDFQRKMRREHLQALAHIKKAMDFLLHSSPRKRITISCNKLRDLLPRVQGTRSDMVTVLEMTIAFLENVQEFAKGHQYREILYPPEQLYSRWLLETHLRKQQCQNKSYEEDEAQKGQQQRSRAGKGLSSNPGPGQSKSADSTLINAERTDISTHPCDNSEGTGCSDQPHTDLPSEAQSMSTSAVPSVSADLLLDTFAAPSFWSPAVLMSPVNPASQTL